MACHKGIDHCPSGINLCQYPSRWLGSSRAGGMRLAGPCLRRNDMRRWWCFWEDLIGQRKHIFRWRRWHQFFFLVWTVSNCSILSWWILIEVIYWSQFLLHVPLWLSWPFRCMATVLFSFKGGSKNTRFFKQSLGFSRFQVFFQLKKCVHWKLEITQKIDHSCVLSVVGCATLEGRKKELLEQVPSRTRSVIWAATNGPWLLAVFWGDSIIAINPGYLLTN